LGWWAEAGVDITVVVGQARERLGTVGVWLQAAVLRSVPPGERAAQFRRIEELGYGSLWTGETPGGGDVFVRLGSVLAATERLVAGSGIANVWARPAVTAHGAAATLGEAYPGRFVLGLGVDYPMQAELVGLDYGRPLGTMAGYLDAMAAGPGQALFPLDPVAGRDRARAYRQRGQRVAARIRAHLAAGADHVLLHPIDDDLVSAVDVLEELAPALR
jgi:hypothetical protein